MLFLGSIKLLEGHYFHVCGNTYHNLQYVSRIFVNMGDHVTIIYQCLNFFAVQ